MPKNPNIKKVLVISILEHTIVFFFAERVEISSFFRSRVVLFTRIDQDIHAMDLLPEITFVDFTSENRLVKHL